MDNNYGFIIIRFVNSEETNNYWIECYKCIRKFYNNKIIIIDDNSVQHFIKYNFPLVNCEIINSEFPRRGELLPYYYLFKNKPFNKAVIIHDSVFIQKFIDFDKYNNIFLWEFQHDWDNPQNEVLLINKMLKNKTYLLDGLIDFYNNKTNWVGCFGVQSVIELSFLTKLVDNYDFFELLKHVTNREDRMSLERCFAVLCHYENRKLIIKPSIFGRIFSYSKLYAPINNINKQISYNDYITNNYTKRENVDIIKVWTGR